MKKLDELTGLFKEELSLFLSISFGLFLFVLFFQPFPLDRFDFNNRLIFVAGLGLIVFLALVLIRVAMPSIFKNSFNSNQESDIPAYLSGFIILAITSVASAFYLRFVGHVGINFYVMIKVILICLAVPLTLSLHDGLKKLRLQNESLIKERKAVQKRLEKYEEDYLNKTIEFYSETGTEKLSFQVADVAFIKSADNYVEIVYREGTNFRKKLIRNTLKNIEHQISPYSNFIRCHRICIVNLHYIEKIESDYTNHWLVIRAYNEKIPVSRQYLLKLKESI